MERVPAARIAVVMGSDSDWSVMQHAVEETDVAALLTRLDTNHQQAA